MSGTESFPMTVEIAFTGGPMDASPTWTDVSDYVQRARSITLSRGYDQETGEVMAGRGSLRLKNDDGRFTPGATGTYGLIRNKLQIRVKRSTTVLWTGLIEKWTMTYDNGRRPVVDLTLVDRWARFQARKFTSERLQPAITATGPDYFWPLTDASGSSRAADVASGIDWVPTDAAGFTFGAAANPQTGNSTNVASSTSQNAFIGPAFIPSGATNWTFGAWLNAGYYALTDLGLPAPNKLVVENNGTSGYKVEVVFNSVTKTSTITSGATAGWHHLLVTGSTSGGTTTLRFYVDGSQRWTDTISGTPTDGLLFMFSSGVGIAYAAIWDKTLSATQISELYATAITSAMAGDTADVRANRIKAINGGWTLTTQGTFTSTMSSPSWTDKSIATTLNECAQAEAGPIYMDTAGWPVLQSRSYRTASVLAATIPAKVLSADAQWELDDQTLCNVVQVDRMASDTTATTINRRNETSIDLYDEAGRTLQLWLYTDDQAVDRANMEVNMFASPLPRSRTFTVDLATCQADLSEATVLGIDVGDRIAISGLPATAPAASTGGWYVEAIEDNISHTNWTRTYTVSPVKDYWVLQDATYGALDSTFVLAY